MRVSVIGLARSGYAAARLARRLGYAVKASDACAGAHQSEAARSALEERAAELRAQDVWVETGRHTPACVDGADIVVTSPGVPESAAPLALARERGIPVISEVEFAVRHTSARIIAITGTNGKTTTTALTGHVLNRAGIPAVVAGNIGQALSAVVEDVSAQQTLVLEISSFQLAAMENFHPFIAVWLNLTPDHLDRHGTMEAYAAAKGKIFENMTDDDWAVVWNHDREITAPFFEGCAAKRVWLDETGGWAASPQEPCGVVCDNGELVSMFNGNRQTHGTKHDLQLKGDHNVINVLAVCAIARILHVPHHAVKEAVTEFPGLPHRLERVAGKGGVSFINDSKATNVDALVKALNAVPAPISLIAGGYDKGGDFSAAREAIREKVCRLVLIGETSDKLAGELAGTAEQVRASTMAEAVAAAARDVPTGATVLLSPGCASFDMYDDFEERGRDFGKCVRRLITTMD